MSAQIPPLYPEVARLFLADFDAPDAPDMEDAVIAWIIEENGWGPAITGHNPWNLHSRGGLYGQTGTRNAGPGDTDVAVFDTLAHGVLACANDLKVWASKGLYGYAAVIAALKAGNPTGFLAALAKSSWSAGHYGYPKTNRLVSIYEGIAPKAEATPVATSIPTVPHPLSPAAEPVTYTGLLGTLLTVAGQLSSGGVVVSTPTNGISSPEAVALNALISVLPLLVSLITRQFTQANGTVAAKVAIALATPVPEPASPQAPLPSAPAQAPVSSGGVLMDPLTVVSSTPLPAGTQGSIPAETRRWTTQGELLGTIGPAILAFSAEVVLSGPIHGTFWLTATTPPVYVAKADVAASAAPAPAVTPAPVAVVPAPTALTYHGLNYVPAPDLAGPPYQKSGIRFAAWAAAWINANFPGNQRGAIVDVAAVVALANPLEIKGLCAASYYGDPDHPAGAGLDFSWLTSCVGISDPQGQRYTIWVLGQKVASIVDNTGHFDTAAFMQANGVTP